MKIYVGHSRKFNFKEELYKPLRESELNNIAEIILPHEKSDESFPSKEILKQVDYMIAEVSYPSDGLGIELVWADSYGKPIIAVYKSGSVPSDSVKALAQNLIEYSSSKDLVTKLKEILIHAD